MPEHDDPTTTNGHDGVPTTSWSREHYGFAEVAGNPVPPQVPRTSSVTSARRRGSRTRLLLASGAVALGLVTGTAGFAFAQSGVDADGRVAAVHPGHGRGPHTVADGDRR